MNSIRQLPILTVCVVITFAVLLHFISLSLQLCHSHLNKNLVIVVVTAQHH